MARNHFALATGPISTGTVLKTLAQLIAGADQIVAIDKVSISFEGTSPTATPIKVQVVRQTTAGTPGSTPAPKKIKDTSTNLRVTAGINYSAEPAAGDVMHEQYLHPQAGETHYLDLPKEIEIPGGGRLGVAVTAPSSVNAEVTLGGEE